jgi:hypothetical protein
MTLRLGNLRRSPVAPRGIVASLALLLCLAPAVARSGEKPAADKAAAKGAKLVSFAATGLPRYAPPASYHEDLVIHGKNGEMTMKRFVDHGQIRTEMASEGQQFVMLETGDSKGTSYMLMPDEKRAMKQSREAMAETASKAGVKSKKEGEAGAKSAAPPDVQVEDLGDATLDGAAVKKLRMTYEGGDVLGWFDKATGAPVRMEGLVDGEKSTIEWKNREMEPQPAELFAVPKNYEVTDMDEMMKKMGAMGGMGGLGGMAKGMAGGMVQGMGSNLGGSLGSALGGSLGGPLGAAAGQFLGGKIGGMLGKKAANAIN